MAEPTTKTFSQFILEIESDDSPGDYDAPCGFDTKSLTVTAASSDATVPDCDDPEAVAWLTRNVNSLSASIQGAGVMATEDSPIWDGWIDSGEQRNIQIRVPGVGYRRGPAIITSLGHSVALKTNANLVQRADLLIRADYRQPKAWGRRYRS